MLLIETQTQTPAQAQAAAEVQSCLSRQRELYREFGKFFGRLETLLSELETDLWQAYRARESGLRIEREITRLLDRNNLSRDEHVTEYFTFTISEGRRHALLVRLNVFANMIRNNEPTSGNPDQDRTSNPGEVAK